MAMRDHDISQSRACRLVGVDPKTVRRERPSRPPRQSKRSFDERGITQEYARR